METCAGRRRGEEGGGGGGGDGGEGGGGQKLGGGGGDAADAADAAIVVTAHVVEVAWTLAAETMSRRGRLSRTTIEGRHAEVRRRRRRRRRRADADAAIAGVISTPEARDLKLCMCYKTSTWTIAFLYDYKITGCAKFTF